MCQWHSFLNPGRVDEVHLSPVSSVQRQTLLCDTASSGYWVLFVIYLNDWSATWRIFTDLSVQLMFRGFFMWRIFLSLHNGVTFEPLCCAFDANQHVHIELHRLRRPKSSYRLQWHVRASWKRWTNSITLPIKIYYNPPISNPFTSVVTFYFVFQSNNRTWIKIYSISMTKQIYFH